VLFLLASLPFLTNGQSYFKDHFGGTAGIVFNVGSHVNSIGINLKGYYTDYFFQTNVGTTFYLHESSYGKRRRFWESRTTAGVVLLAGKKERQIDFQLDGLNHQTDFNYGVGFNYIIYRDNVGTSQVSGGFGAHIKNLSVYHENDVFGGKAGDKYRTAHFYASYQYDDLKFGAGVNLWTGDSRKSNWQKITFDGCPSGFKVLEDVPYGRTSHGNAYGAIVINAPYGQDVHLKFGIDSEHVRHVIQNRLVHDLGRFISRGTPQYPRLDKHGCPVFNKEDARPSLLFLQFGCNDNWSN
jgi:hypothetical protein